MSSVSDEKPANLIKQRFVVLDALRGVAALCVMMHHAEQFYGHPGVFAHAYLAVDFFFMLSGLVISDVYATRFASGMNLSRFLVVRVKRLWPTLVIGVVLGGLLALAQGHQPITVLIDLVAGLSFAPILRGDAGLFMLDGVEWSLFFELVANLVHRLGLWRLSIVPLFVLSAVSLCGLLFIAAQNHGIAVGDRGVSFVAGFARVAFPYVIGMLLQRMWQSGSRRLILPELIPIAALPACFVLAAVIEPSLAWIVEPLIVAFVFPLIIWLGACAKMQPRYKQLGLLGGALSYPIYTIHLPMIGAGDLVARLVSPQLGILARLFALGACVGGAWLIARYVEKTAVTRRA